MAETIELDLTPLVPPENREVKRHLYHIGVTPGSKCPRQNIAIGGKSFPLYTEEVKRIEGSPVTHRTQMEGSLIYLSDAELEFIKKRMRTMVFRGSRLLTTEARNYKPALQDQPVARFVYMRRLSEGERPMTRAIPAEVVALEPALSEKEQANTKAMNLLKKTGQKVDPPV